MTFCIADALVLFGMFTVVQLGEEHPLGMPAPAVELFRVEGRSAEIGPLARHVATPQLLAAMDGGRWGLWLAPAGDAPVSPSWHEFAAHEAVLLEPGTWHRGPVPLDAASGTYLTVEAPRTNEIDFEERDPA
jgi:hypothetical protein